MGDLDDRDTLPERDHSFTVRVTAAFDRAVRASAARHRQSVGRWLRDAIRRQLVAERGHRRRHPDPEAPRNPTEAR